MPALVHIDKRLMIYVWALYGAGGRDGSLVVYILPTPPPCGLSRPRLVDIQDKGAGKGALALVRTETVDEATGRLLAVCEFVIFVLGGGGCAGR